MTFVRPRELRAIASVLALAAGPGTADEAKAPVSVRYPEGLVHGYLVLRDRRGGEVLASGDMLQRVRGSEVSSRLVFAFKDGSSHDETVVFSQRRSFGVLRYTLAQRGPSFPRELEMSLDARRGEVAVRYEDEDGEWKREADRRELPPDLANGLVPVMLKNAREWPRSLSFVAATPKPRLVGLEVAAPSEERFHVAGTTRTALHYVIKVEIGGLTGIVAPLVGKQPPDVHVWIQAGEFPGFLASEGPLYTGGPSWRIELASPSWPSEGG
jgi:hypothetical protein